MTLNVPNLPVFYDMAITEKGDRMSGEGLLYNDNFWQTLNEVVNLFNYGIRFPSFTTAEIVALEPDAGVGTTWFNTSLAKLQVKTAAGVIETITSV